MAEHTKCRLVAKGRELRIEGTRVHVAQVISTFGGEISIDYPEAEANAERFADVWNNYDRLREENAALVKELSEYVILGRGKCTIGEAAFLMGQAALKKVREGNGDGNG